MSNAVSIHCLSFKYAPLLSEQQATCPVERATGDMPSYPLTNGTKTKINKKKDWVSRCHAASFVSAPLCEGHRAWDMAVCGGLLLQQVALSSYRSPFLLTVLKCKLWRQSSRVPGSIPTRTRVHTQAYPRRFNEAWMRHKRTGEPALPLLCPQATMSPRRPAQGRGGREERGE